MTTTTVNEVGGGTGRTIALPKWRLWVGVAVMTASVLGAALAGRLDAGGPAIGATLLALATLVAAWLVDGYGPFPTWSRRTMAGILATSVLAAGLLPVDPAKWSEALSSSLWLAPWFVLIMGMTPAGSCAHVAPRHGWYLVGGSVLLVGIMTFACWWGA